MTRPIYVDLQAAQNPSHAGRGISRYSVELTLAMLRAGLPVAAVALSPYHPTVELPADLAASPLLVTRSAQSIGKVADDARFAYHLMSPMELDLTPSRTLSATALRRADAVVAVLYDLIPLLFPDRYLVSPRSRATYDARLGLLRDVDLLLAISEHTRRDAIEHLGIPPERVAVIGGGASDFFRPPASAEEPHRVLGLHHPEIHPPFLLTVAAWEWRKNLETLVHAVARLDTTVRRDRQLVVVCSGMPPGERTWQRVAAEAGLGSDQFVVVGPVSDEVLRALYQATELFVFPSRYEGFGLPVVEAARCGAPTVTSSTSSLPEILELPASTFPPDDEIAMAAVIERGLTDPSFRAELLAAASRASARHTWDAVGANVAAAYTRLERGVGTNPPVASRSARIAFVGDARDLRIPRLLAEMPDVALHVFEPGSPRPRATHRPDVPVYPLAALERLLDPYDYDLVVYDAGTCASNDTAARFVATCPGAVSLDSGPTAVDDVIAGLARARI